MISAFIRVNLVRLGDILAWSGVGFSLAIVLLRFAGVREILGIAMLSYFTGGIWLMVLGVLIRLEVLLTAGNEKAGHPELRERETSMPL